MVIGVIPRPKILTGQPQSAVSIDWSNPNTRGLIGAWTASTPSLLGGNSAPSGTIITTAPTPGGRVWRGTDAATSDNCIRIPRGPMTYTQECTFEVLFRLNTLASSNNIGIMSQYQTVSGVDVYGPAMGFTTGFGISRINFSVRTGAAWRTATTGTGAAGIVAGQLVHVVCTASVAAGSILQIYIDGVQRAVASFFAGSFTNDPNNFLSLLSSYVDGGGNNCAGIDMYLARVYNVGKSPTEIQALYKDPWGMFKQTQFLHTDSTPSPTSRTFFIPSKKVMSSQPQGNIQINWDNPITRGLACVYIPQRSPQTPIDPVSGAVAVNNFVATRLPDVLPANGGSALVTNSITGDTRWGFAFDIPNAPAGRTGYPVLSIFSRCEILNTTGEGTIWGAGQAFSPSTNINIALQLYKSNDRIDLVPSSNAGGNITGPTFSTNRVYNLGGVQRFTNNYRAYYIDGALYNSNTSNFNNLNSGFQAGSAYRLNATSFQAKIYCGYVWQRELTAAEMQSLSDNPWQIFKQPRLSPALAEDGKVYASFTS